MHEPLAAYEIPTRLPNTRTGDTAMVSRHGVGRPEFLDDSPENRDGCNDKDVLNHASY